MPYLAFDLEAMDRAPNVGRAAGISEDAVLAGLARMWRHCWQEKTDQVDATAVRGFFGADVQAALISFRFLEARESGFRVRGADRYLRITHAQSEAGKKASGNLKRGKLRAVTNPEYPAVEPESLSGSSPAGSPGPPPAKPENVPGSYTEHRALSIEHRALKEETYVEQRSTAVRLAPMERPHFAGAILEVFDHWRAVMNHPKAVLDVKRRKRIVERLQEGKTAEDLKQAVDGCARTPHNMGQNEHKQRYDDIELICRDASHVERFMRQKATSARWGDDFEVIGQ